MRNSRSRLSRPASLRPRVNLKACRRQLANATLSSVDAAHAGIVSVALNSARQIGGMLGVAVCGFFVRDTEPSLFLRVRRFVRAQAWAVFLAFLVTRMRGWYGSPTTSLRLPETAGWRPTSRLEERRTGTRSDGTAAAALGVLGDMGRDLAGSTCLDEALGVISLVGPDRHALTRARHVGQHLRGHFALGLSAEVLACTLTTRPWRLSVSTWPR